MTDMPIKSSLRLMSCIHVGPIKSAGVCLMRSSTSCWLNGVSVTCSDDVTATFVVIDSTTRTRSEQARRIIVEKTRSDGDDAEMLLMRMVQLLLSLRLRGKK